MSNSEAEVSYEISDLIYMGVTIHSFIETIKPSFIEKNTSQLIEKLYDCVNEIKKNIESLETINEENEK